MIGASWPRISATHKVTPWLSKSGKKLLETLQDLCQDWQGKPVMVMDGAGWHSSKSLVAPSNIRLLALPPYAPELNPVEHLWDDLREKCFHNNVFSCLDALEDDLMMGLLAMENTPEVIKSITYWPWIIDVLSKSK
jgi:transposase